MMTRTNDFDPDEAQQNVGPHLGSKLLKLRLHHQQKFGMETMNALQFLKLNDKIGKDDLKLFDKIYEGKVGLYQLAKQKPDLKIYSILTNDNIVK